MVWILAKVFRPDLKCLITGLNTLFTIGKGSNFPMNTMGVVILNGPATVDLFQQLLTERVLSIKNSDGELLYVGLKLQCVKFLTVPFWKEDLNFDLKNHVRYYDYTGALELPNAPSEMDLHNVLGKLIKLPWKKNQSPWEMLLIQNYKGENYTGFVVRLNHVLADGLSIFEMFKLLSKSEWSIPVFKRTKIEISKWQRMGRALKTPYDLFSNLLLCYGESKFPTKTMRFDQVVLSNLVTTIVLPKKNHPGGLCIHAHLAPAKWPLQYASTKDLMESVQNSMRGITTSAQATVLGNIFKAAHFIPTWIAAFNVIIDCINPVKVNFANVPVTTGLDYFEGNEILELITANTPIFKNGLLISMGGVNNKQRASFCSNMNMFGSDDIARSLGSLFAEEIQNLVLTIT
ncbi:unnamed protein product [Allacma fusca]|uniref:O-acyltransferase WSD1-like N-terminal domain-containing protein n=1 Tax=Allacma fusca TaxID=39272 RepID=A0A8J2JHX8_9HEXA|nr:unnamed protein product [Allacma fusca]